MPYYPNQPPRSLGDNSVTDAQLVDMPDGTVKGREIGAGAGDPSNIGRALSYRNILGRNGGFEVWQRGAGGSAGFTVPAASGMYTADGWCMTVAASQISTLSQQAGLTPNSRYCLAASRASGQTGVGQMSLEFPLDSDEIVLMRGSIVTLSMSLLAGSATSPAGGIIEVILICGTGVSPARQASITGQTYPLSATVAIATTTARYSVTSTVVVPTTTTQATLLLRWTPVGTATGADYIAFDDVQLEIGSVATPFERRPFESELLACKRHFQKSFAYNTAPASTVGGSGPFASVITAGATTQQFPSICLAPSMRAAPTAVFYNPGAAGNDVRNVSIGVSHTSLTVFAADGERIAFNSIGAAGGLPGHGMMVNYTADAGI